MDLRCTRAFFGALLRGGVASCLLAPLFFLALPENGEAVGNLRLGPFGIHPYVTANITHSDNFLRTPFAEESDTALFLTPGIYFETDRDDRKLRFLYESVIEKFSELDNQDAWGHQLEGRAHFELAGGLMLELSDVYLYTHDERGSSILITGPGTLEVDTDLAFLKDNTIRLAAGYEFADVYRIRGDVAYNRVDYKGINEFRDRKAVAYAATLFYRLRAKTSLLAELTITDTNFDDSDDLDSLESDFMLGVTWEITGKSTGTFKAGYGRKEFDTAATPDFDGFIYSITINHAFNDWTSLVLEGIRNVNETNVVGANYFNTTDLSARLVHKFTAKISATGEINYVRDDYSQGLVMVIEGSPETADRLDETWIFNLEAMYDIREWLGVKAGYNYRDRNSSFDAIEYEENRFFFEVFTIL